MDLNQITVVTVVSEAQSGIHGMPSMIQSGRIHCTLRLDDACVQMNCWYVVNRRER